MFSTNGPRARPEIPKDAGGFTFVPLSESERLDTEEYGSTFVRPDVVQDLARDASIAHLKHLEQELWLTQDLYVASPASLEALASWRPTPQVFGSIDALEIRPDGRFMVSGWAADPRSGAPLAEVRIRGFDHEERAELAHVREDVARFHQRDDFSQSGWILRGHWSPPPPNSHTDSSLYLVTATGKTLSGFECVFDLMILKEFAAPLESQSKGA